MSLIGIKVLITMPVVMEVLYHEDGENQRKKLLFEVP
jgi:hypothetical protein